MALGLGTRIRTFNQILWATSKTEEREPFCPQETIASFRITGETLDGEIQKPGGKPTGLLTTWAPIKVLEVPDFLHCTDRELLQEGTPDLWLIKQGF